MMAVVLLSLSAETLVRNGVWSDPVKLFQESVDLAPTHYRPRILLGEALEDLGRRNEAIEQYRLAVRFRPAELDSYLKLSVALAGAGRIDEARQTLKQALAVDPNNELALRAMSALDRYKKTS
jgi:Flp pilus assembly protein TadD